MKQGKKKKKGRTGAGLITRRTTRILWILAAVTMVIAAVLFYIRNEYLIRNIYVDGNSRYTDEEIVGMVLKDELSRNSLILSARYRDKSITDIPFIEKMDVKIESRDTVRINVYEKALAGYIAYLGNYVYFDRDGIVVESSGRQMEGVPQVLGLDFGYVVMYDRLPVDNDRVFAEILDIAQLLEKFELEADKIFFDAKYHVYLYFGSIRAEIGTEEYISEKIGQLPGILEKLEGKSGVIRMREYTPEKESITFEES